MKEKALARVLPVGTPFRRFPANDTLLAFFRIALRLPAFCLSPDPAPSQTTSPPPSVAQDLFVSISGRFGCYPLVFLNQL
jgi:hypothetical protein